MKVEGGGVRKWLRNIAMLSRGLALITEGVKNSKNL